MTFDTQETGAWSGEPVELYEFTMETKKYRYTSADSTQLHNGIEFTPASIKRAKIYQGQQLNKSDLTISVARDNPVAQLFLSWAPASVVQVSVYQYHIGAAEYRVIWSGRVLAVSQPGGPKAELHCEPISSSLRRYGLMRVTSVACPVVLYGVECGVNREAFSASGTVSAISGATLTVAVASGQVDGYYAGGFAKWANPDGINIHRTIMSHVGAALELIAPMHGMPLSAPITIYPGCDKTWTTCDVKFSNKLNYRGQRHLPLDVNPLAGGKVF